MSTINSILYCNEELSDENENQVFQSQNEKPLFDILYTYHLSQSFPFSNSLLEVRINRFIQGEFTLIAVLNPVICYIYDISNENGIQFVTGIYRDKEKEIFLTCDWITMKDKDNMQKIYLLIGCKSGIIKVCDVITRSFICDITDHKGAVHFVRSIKNNSPQFLSIGDDRVLRLWDIRRRKPYRKELEQSTPPYYAMTVSSSGNRVSLLDSNNQVFIFDIYGTKLHPHTVESQPPNEGERDEKSLRKMERYRKRQENLLKVSQQPLRNRYILSNPSPFSWIGSYFINALERYPVKKEQFFRHFEFICNELRIIDPNITSQLSVCSNGIFMFLLRDQFIDIFQIKDSISYYSTVKVMEEMGKPIRAYFLETSKQLIVITDDYSFHYLTADNVPEPIISFTPGFCNLIELIHAIRFKEKMGLYVRSNNNVNENACFLPEIPSYVFPFSDDFFSRDYSQRVLQEEQVECNSISSDLPFTSPNKSLNIVNPFIEGDFSSIGGLPSLEELEEFVTKCKNQKRRKNLDRKKPVFDNPDMLPPPPRKIQKEVTKPKQDNFQIDLLTNNNNNGDNGLSTEVSEKDFCTSISNINTISFTSDLLFPNSLVDSNDLFLLDIPSLDLELNDFSMLPDNLNSPIQSISDDNIPFLMIPDMEENSWVAQR